MYDVDLFVGFVCQSMHNNYTVLISLFDLFS